MSVVWIAGSRSRKPPHLAIIARVCETAPHLEINIDLRDLSCRDRCSDLLKARLQNWHLYRFSFSLSGAAALRVLVGETDADGWTAPATADMAPVLAVGLSLRMHSQRHRSINSR